MKKVTADNQIIMIPTPLLWTACIASISMIVLPKCKAEFAVGMVPFRCMECLCKIESRCQPKPCASGDGPTTCGYFGITEAYYNACGRPGNGWKECATDQICSSHCVQNYMAKNIKNCYEHNCLSYARLHKGGPSGCNNPHTMTYALWIQKCATQSG